MPKTKEFLKGSNIFFAVNGAICEAIFCKMASLSYFFMILSQILNAGLVSIAYPFAVFGYALMEEGRPGKSFWRTMTVYTFIILFLKFLVQLDFWKDFGVDESYNSFNVRMPCCSFTYSPGSSQASGVNLPQVLFSSTSYLKFVYSPASWARPTMKTLSVSMKRKRSMLRMYRKRGRDL